MLHLLLIVVGVMLVRAARGTTVVRPGEARVVDGDTVELRGQRWRTQGYDAPEWNQDGGREAHAHLAAILGEGRWIARARDIDAYGRIVVDVATAKGPLAWRMAIAGHGVATGMVGATLTATARRQRRGMWRTDEAIDPRTWRRLGL